MGQMRACSSYDFYMFCPCSVSTGSTLFFVVSTLGSKKMNQILFFKLIMFFFGARHTTMEKVGLPNSSPCFLFSSSQFGASSQMGMKVVGNGDLRLVYESGWKRSAKNLTYFY